MGENKAVTKTASIREEYIVEKQGKKFVLAPGLVDAAHRAFTSLSIVSVPIQIGDESNGNCWIVSTRVDCDNGAYVQWADASPANAGRQMLTCLPRLAETRSVSRALRLAVNAGVLAIFDDPDEDDDAGRTQAASQDARARGNTRNEPSRSAEPAAFAEPAAKPIARAEPTLARAPGPPHAGPATMPTPHATEQQVQTIYRLGADRHQLATKALDADCALRFANLKPAELSVDQAGQYIKMLQRGELTR